jgi:hypothetical protein
MCLLQVIVGLRLKPAQGVLDAALHLTGWKSQTALPLRNALGGGEGEPSYPDTRQCAE